MDRITGWEDGNEQENQIGEVLDRKTVVFPMGEASAQKEHLSWERVKLGMRIDLIPV